MQVKEIEFDEIHYNPEHCAFEVRATVHEAGVDYVYPADVPAPLTAEPRLILRKLSERARKMHQSRGRFLHMVRPLCVSGETSLHARAA